VLVAERGPGQLLGPESVTGYDSGNLIERLGHRASAAGGEPGEVDPERVVVGRLQVEADQVAGRGFPWGVEGVRVLRI